ncbi:hypothetical protein [Bosea vestrisii]|uniref:SMODS and SLOG-associating 2TM effector domain-containing protein n=1 Tax=Bosea vestrisii TaxID=151416 RepID=A0ABW0H844_9HYPH
MVDGESTEATVTAPAIATTGQRRGHTADPNGSTTATGQSLTDRDIEAMRCERGVWYHDDLERHYTRLHRILMFAVIVAGAGAGAQISESLGWFDAKWLGIAGAIIGAIDIAWDISGKARLHATLKRDAVNILERVTSGAELEEVRAAIARSHADEPTMMHAVNFMAYNAVQRARGRPESTCVEVGAGKRLLRHWIAFTPESFSDKVQPVAGT